MSEQEIQERALQVIRGWFPSCTVTVYDGTEEGESGLIERGIERVASFAISPEGRPMVGMVGDFCGTVDEQAAFKAWIESNERR